MRGRGGPRRAWVPRARFFAPSRRSLACQRSSWHHARVRNATLLLLSLLSAVACDKSVATVDAGPPAASVTASASSPPSATAAASAAPKPPPDSVACQHVLVAYKGAKNAPPTVTRTKAQAKSRADEVLQKARAGEDFAALAQTYSDDQGSRERLGSAGKFKRDGMVKPFSDAAFALQVDQISDVVETPFGFHVIKRNQ